MKIDVKEIEKLLKVLENSGVSEIEVKQGEESLRISTQRTFIPPSPLSHHIIPGPLPTAPAAAAPEPSAKPAETGGHRIKSPMVGTYYAKPSPEAPIFVSVGQRVNKGEPLCIIEAMKMMNRIEADVAGVIKAILVENASPVEFDQPLFIIETD